ncbi:nuclease-related domain-containing protein [Arthrobacter sp. efr-133-R2A-120]|uniref:nuclease-related domain-containing protein n=1 Tax=Arthrobacter sp. efr-133-R2A-120 TaxID=3040277 RepID=UPI00254C37D0|nr:nuclease-related domain-containing protein [Arthrobacter sp. efr-133-R2A-120]
MRSEPASQDFPLRPGGNLERGGLSDRIPGQSVIEKLLADRTGASSRSFLGRIFGADPLTPDNHPWYKGALGEIAVGRILERLGPEWTVLHAVPVGAGTSDIDHVLIGPSGVFTLNTKNHTGQSVWVAGRTLMVAGKKQRHLHNAGYEAARAAKLLTSGANQAVDVTGVVVIVAPKSMTVRERPSGVAVVTDRQLLRWLNGRPTVITPTQKALVAAAAVRAGTWHRNPPAGADAASLQHEFAALRTLVDRARLRRAGWMLALSILALVVLANLTRFF